MDANQLRDNNPEATREVLNSIPDPNAGKVEETQPVIPQGGETQPIPAEQTPPAEQPAEGTHTAKSRIIEQSKKINELESSVDDLAGISALGSPILPKLNIEPGQDISPEDYEKHVNERASALVDLKIAANNNANRIKLEIREALGEYPELNPKKTESFDEELSDSMSEDVKNFIRLHPTENVKAFIDKRMNPYKKAIEKKAVQTATETQETVARQASQTALRPTTAAAPAKKFEELSIKEMEAKLGKVY